jgi:hypothetical protein
MFISLVSTISIGFTLLSGPKAVAQTDYFPDIPVNHWAYDTLAVARRLDLLPEIHLFLTGRPFSKYEIANFNVHIVLSLPYLKGAFENLHRLQDGSTISGEKFVGLLEFLSRNLVRLEHTLRVDFPSYVNEGKLEHETALYEKDVSAELRKHGLDPSSMHG